MGKIQVLDHKLANMIAAGEVVERPSSVLKELVENSIDAGAKRIQVVVRDAGRTFMSVEDDGCGMDENDVLLAFKRHATSKISSAFDLFRIHTLGFRGEALPSIASVSKMHVITSTGVGVGSEVWIEDEELTRKDASLRKGTKIEVEELFYNTPARLKYLKSDTTENASNLDTMVRIALAHPEVAITYTSEGRVQFQTTGRGDLLENIAAIYGFSVAKKMIPFHYECPDYEISGYLGQPELAKSSRYYMITLLNGRNVYMPKVQKAIQDGYHDYLAPTRFPFVVLDFHVDFALVDVNVHPSKKEVRFSKEEDLRHVLLENIPSALQPISIFDEPVLTKEVPVKKEEKVEQMTFLSSEEIAPTLPSEEQSVFAEKTVPYEEKKEEAKQEIKPQEEIHRPKILPDIPRKNSPIIPLAQLNKTYIIGEAIDGDGFYLIDQHAAMERINFEYYRTLYLSYLEVTRPLIPIVITLNPSDDILFTEEKKACLKEVGIELSPFGYQTYQVTSIPTWMMKEDEQAFVEELLHMALHEDHISVESLRRHAIATIACKASLKANAAITLHEMQVLLERLFACENPHNCPHGRPIMIHFTKYEVEKMFKRTGV